MLLARLRAGGLAAHRTSMLIAQVWLTTGAVVCLFAAMAHVLGQPAASGGAGAEVGDVGRRFSALDAEAKWLFGAGAVMAVGLFALLLHSIARAMREAPPPT